MVATLAIDPATARLAAQGQHLETERDTITGGWIVRNPRIPGRCHIVTPDGACTCRHYRLWDRCKHSAVIATRHDMTLRIIPGGKA